MRFSPANLAAINACQPSAAHPELETTSAGFTDSAIFGSLLREQIPSAPAGSENQREPAGEASADPALASIGAEQKSGCSSEAVPIAMPPGVEIPNARPALPQGGRQLPRSAAQPTERPGSTAPSAEAENPTMSSPKTRLASDVSPGKGGIAMPAHSTVTSSGPAGLSKQILAVASSPASARERSIPVQQGDRPDTETSEAKHKSGAAEKSHFVTTDRGLLKPKHTVGSRDVASSATTVPDAQNATAGGVSALSHQNFSERRAGFSQPLSGSHSLSSTQPTTPPAGQQKADGTSPNPSEKESAAEPSDLSALHISAHNAQTVLVTASARTFEVRHGTGAPTADSQHGETPVSAVGAVQTAPAQQGSGLAGSAVSGHRSVTGPDQSLRPAAALERMDAADAPRLLESSPQKLTVGFRDAGLGWIEIRTHAVAGQVSATLATGTHESEAAVAAELPSLRNTLINQNVALHSLGTEQFSASSGGGGSASNSSDSGNPAFQPQSKSRWDPPSAQSDADENLSYINVRV